MARPRGVDPVKLFAAMLWAGDRALESAMETLAACFGAIDYQGADHPFDLTDYYEPEMGRGLRRRLVSFRQPVEPECLIEAKHRCNGIEDGLAGNHGRTVNLDIGYLDQSKIVLASFKGAGQKVYLGRGVWADMVARYRGGRYAPFEWTFPDFRDGRYDSELQAIRSIYRGQIALLRARPGGA